LIDVVMPFISDLGKPVDSRLVATVRIVLPLAARCSESLLFTMSAVYGRIPEVSTELVEQDDIDNAALLVDDAN
jgi:hypothetical protein